MQYCGINSGLYWWRNIGSKGLINLIKAFQLFTRNAQAPKPPSNRFETTSEGGFLELVM